MGINVVNDFNGVKGVQSVSYICILIINEQQSLHHCQKCHKVAENTTGFAADKLGYVEVFFCGIIDEPVEKASSAQRI